MKSAKKLGLFVSGITTTFVSAAVITGTYIPEAQATNLVTNPGFDIDPLVHPNNPTLPNPFITGWINDSDPTNSGFNTIYLENYYALSPDRSAHIAGRYGASLSQTLNTIAGQRYELSYYLAGVEEEPRLDNELNILVGGNLIGRNVNTGLSGFIRYAYNFTAASALTELRFDARVRYEWINIDDVSVTPVPEASTLGGIAVVGLMGIWLKRKQLVGNLN